jgi:hypothetical protein
MQTSLVKYLCTPTRIPHNILKNKTIYSKIYYKKNTIFKNNSYNNSYNNMYNALFNLNKQRNKKKLFK